MCGIAGVVGPAIDLLPALQSLHLRGPDGAGQWTAPGITLGHTRLAINNPAHGAQPFHWRDRFVAVVNGEFYGHEASATTSDSWALVQAWQDDDLTHTLSHLRGEFAFLVHDRQKGTTYAARDRFGVKPLYWARHRNSIFFASKPSALWALGLPRGWSDDGFWHAACTQYPSLRHGLFEGIQEVPPGHWLEVTPEGSLAQHRYWSPPRLEEARSEDPVGDFHTALREAVTLRVRQGSSTAVMLSGGVDSASVLALAAEATPACNLHAFSVDFPSEDYSYAEGQLASEQALRSGVSQHTVLSLDSAALLQGLEDAVRGTLGLMVNAHGPAKYALTRAIAEAGHSVALTGEGADELLFGYSHFTPHLPGHSTADPLRDPAGLGILLARGEAPGLAGVEEDLGFRPQVWVAKWQLGQRITAFLRGDFLHAYDGQDPFLETAKELGPTGSRLEISRDLWLGTALRSYILETLGDGCEMAHSVEGRPPFLDHHLWETTARLPLHLVTAAPGKGLLRQAMGSRLTPTISSRPKHPFMAPPLGRSLIGAVENVVLTDPHPYVDPHRTLATLKRLESLEGPDSWEWEPALLWLLSSYYLQRVFA